MSMVEKNDYFECQIEIRKIQKSIFNQPFIS